MRRWAALSLLGVLAACDRPGLKPIDGDLTVAPAAIDFGSVFIGYPIEREVVLSNHARADRTVALTVDAPFSIEAPLVNVPGGAELRVPVRFAPLREGPWTAKLLDVELTGAGVAPPQCVAPSVCRSSTFDAAVGACVEAPVADGTACTDACVTGGACMNGKCKGAALSCADSDACTVDACDPVSGCVRVPLQCGAATNPCKVARCDAQLGCVEIDALDGTSCGPADCTTAQVCLLGECKAAAVPNGATCAPATPCQGAGTCQQNACTRPPAGQLAEVWHYDFPGWDRKFTGVTDAAQNLYWMECAFGCSAVSYSRDGVFRFRTPVPTMRPAAHLLVGDVLVFGWGETVGAIALSDGAPRWAVQLPATLPGATDTADAPQVVSLAADAAGLWVNTVRWQGTTLRRSAVLRLSPANGAVQLARFYDGILEGAVVDTLDAFYFHVGTELVSLSAAGAERWRKPAGTPVAAFGGEVVLESGEVRAAADGALKAAAPVGDLWSNPLMSAGGRTLLREPLTGGLVNAIGLAPGAASPTWETLLVMLHITTITDSLATKRGDLLVATGGTRHPYRLVAIDAAGAERYACELAVGVPGGAQLEVPAALLDGRWAALEMNGRLRVFDVPGEQPATHGWVSAKGSPLGAGRPLP